MRLRTRIWLSMMGVLLSATLIIVGMTQIIFRNAFEQYLHQQQQEKVDKIFKDLTNLIAQDGYSFTAEKLTYYAKDENINLRVEDLHGFPIAEYRGLQSHRQEDLKVSSIEFTNSSGKNVGRILITYDVANPSFVQAQSIFESHVRASILLVCLVIALIGFAISFNVSQKITQPIAQLSKITHLIRKKQYHVQAPDSKIREIYDLTLNMRFLAQSLEQQETIRKQYAQDISHELRTPITNLLLQIEAMQDGMLPTDDSSLQRIHKTAQKLQNITEHLKDSFEQSSLLSEIHYVRTDLAKVLDTLIDGFEASAQLQNTTLHRDWEHPLEVITDPRLFSHIVSNLLSNALKAIDKEEGLISIRCHRTDRGFVLEVWDNGMGIAKENLPRIFERFYRGDPARTTKYQNHGLGLSILSNIVSQLNGTVTVKSTLGEQTGFTVFLPSEESYLSDENEMDEKERKMHV